MKGILLSLGILIPTILPSQIRLVPFPGIFSTYIGAHLSKRQFRLRPFLGDFFSIRKRRRNTVHRTVFVPFLGDLFSIRKKLVSMQETEEGFRPLSRGLFFNTSKRRHLSTFRMEHVFVPFLGDLFSIYAGRGMSHVFTVFSSPFSGTFFQWLTAISRRKREMRLVFVPFLGDLFSITRPAVLQALKSTKCFRPLSRGPFFNSKSNGY